jgi:hypothetical protein
MAQRGEVKISEPATKGEFCEKNLFPMDFNVLLQILQNRFVHHKVWKKGCPTINFWRKKMTNFIQRLFQLNLIFGVILHLSI